MSTPNPPALAAWIGLGAKEPQLLLRPKSGDLRGSKPLKHPFEGKPTFFNFRVSLTHFDHHIFDSAFFSGGLGGWGSALGPALNVPRFVFGGPVAPSAETFPTSRSSSPLRFSFAA